MQIGHQRIDVEAGGVPTHGLEDACNLLGLPPHEKYATTTEKVLNATRAYLPPARANSRPSQTAASRCTVSGNFSTNRISTAAWALGLARPCSQFSRVRGLVRR